MKRWVMAVGILAVIVPLGAWAIVSSTADGPGPTATAMREDFRMVVEATGTLEAELYYEIGPPSVRDFWQYNLQWMIPEGAHVQEGTVIARFDAQQLEDRLRDHRAELETATQEKEKEERNLEIDLEQLQLDLVEAEGEIEKVALELTVPEEIIPRIELGQLRLEQKLARERVEFLKEKIDFQKELVKNKLDLLEVKKSRASQRIQYYETAQDKFQVKAPINGVVLYIPKGNGDRWEVGEGVWMMAKILKVADVTTLRVEARVLEVDAARIAVDQTAEVTIDALPGRVVRTRVEEIGRIVHERSQQDPSKVFDVVLPLDELDPETMRPGMGVRVSVQVAEIPEQITVPLESVRLTPDGPCVDVVGRGGALERRPVALGPRNDERVVVESGLEEGEQILVGEGAS